MNFIMENKQFKAESKRLLDLMINSIYTNKEIFLRELISNASDAIDKLYYRSLTDKNVKVNKDDLYIRITPNKEARTLTIEDNGCGMNKEELEENLGTIAKSGSLAFKEAAKAKENAEKDDDVNIIGQFGVGFYSAFMVASKVRVESECYGAEKAYAWESEGAEGYTIDECDKSNFGTKIILTLKADTDDEKYSDFLAEYKIEELIRKYSDYIRYPIKMEVEHEHEVEQPEGEKKEPKFEKVRHDEILNSMIPIWKKNKSEVSDEDYNNFYQEKFGDQKAFDTLFRRYYPMLCAYGHRFVELEDAEEIVEDSLLWIWENRETLVIESSLNSYLFKMVYRRALNKLAHIDATQRADTRFYEEMQEMLQDTDYYQIEELAKRIEDAVAALPESYREAFVMHRFRDMSYKEIAETLGVSPKTIDYRIQQALKQLRVDLKDYLPLLLPLLFP